MRKFLVPALAALSLAAIATPAAARTTVRVSVPYADLDLSTESGLSTLQRRIRAAIARICVKPATRDLHDYAIERKCNREAIASVSEQLSRLVREGHALAMADGGKIRH